MAKRVTVQTKLTPAAKPKPKASASNPPPEPILILIHWADLCPWLEVFGRSGRVSVHIAECLRVPRSTPQTDRQAEELALLRMPERWRRFFHDPETRLLATANIEGRTPAEEGTRLLRMGILDIIQHPPAWLAEFGRDPQWNGI